MTIAKTIAAASTAVALSVGTALAEPENVYLTMMITANGVPRQMSAEHSMEKCMETIKTVLSAQIGSKQGNTYYCQPAVRQRVQ